MLKQFNDISIRSKLVVIVGGTVAALTIAMLVSVLLTARREVDRAVHDELTAARLTFLMSEGEHMREHVLETRQIADSVADALGARDHRAICNQLQTVFGGKGAKLDPEDKFALLAVTLPDNSLLGLITRETGGCGTPSEPWRLPMLTDRSRSEVINWEAPDGNLYELIQAPVFDDSSSHDLGTMVVGFLISDSLALHIRQHTGLDIEVALWHMDGNKVHLLASSSNWARDLLSARMQQGPLNAEEILGGKYSVLDAPVAYESDIIYASQGLHIALVQSRVRKLEPFLDLRMRLLIVAGLTLLFGLIIGVLLSRPIANPLTSLALAAEHVAEGNLDSAHDLMHENPGRLHSKDEIGVLGRSFLRMVQELREKMAMSTFLSRSTYEHIRQQASSEDAGRVQDQDKNKSDAGERMSLVILFSDVRKFTNFSENRDPEVVIRLLNQVLSIEAEIVEKHGGDINKFVGDAVVAWFSGEDRCARAVRAANEMMKALNAAFHGQPGTIIGVGIHAGDVVVGSIGSSARKDYTAIGSTVNLAARLCSNAKPGQVLISKAVAAELKSPTSNALDIHLTPLEPIAAKGFSEPVEVFDATLGKAR